MKTKNNEQDIIPKIVYNLKNQNTELKSLEIIPPKERICKNQVCPQLEYYVHGKYEKSGCPWSDEDQKM